jgi:hypothetical protein
MSDPTKAPMRLPDFLIIGEQKCGTTTLWDLLRAHPRVYFPEEKELHYWGSYPQWDPVGRFGDTPLATYADQFEPAGDRVSGEATPNYLFDPGACERIAEHLPNVKAIVILRDPIDRAWSHYWHQVRRGDEAKGFEAAIADEARRLREGGPEAMEARSYTARGHYVQSLERWWAAIGRDRVAVTFLSDLKADPSAVVAELCTFLGIDPDELPPATRAPQRNKASYPAYPTLNRLAGGVKRRLDAWGGPLATAARALADRTRDWRVYSGQPRMKPRTRTQLEALYADSNRALANALGRPLPWADAPASVAPDPDAQAGVLPSAPAAKGGAA